jgi:cytochrome c peroxidase
MHAGQFKSLHDVLEHYNRAAPGPVGHTELKPLRLSPRELQQLEAFLRSLSGGVSAPAGMLAAPALPTECKGCHTTSEATGAQAADSQP